MQKAEVDKLERALATKNPDEIKPYIDKILDYVNDPEAIAIRQIRVEKILASCHPKAINQIPKKIIVPLLAKTDDNVRKILKSRLPHIIDKIPKERIVAFAEKNGPETILDSKCSYAVNAISDYVLHRYLHDPKLTEEQKSARRLRINKSTLDQGRKKKLESEPPKPEPEEIAAFVSQLFNSPSKIADGTDNDYPEPAPKKSCNEPRTATNPESAPEIKGLYNYLFTL